MDENCNQHEKSRVKLFIVHNEIFLLSPYKHTMAEWQDSWRNEKTSSERKKPMRKMIIEEEKIGREKNSNCEEKMKRKNCQRQLVFCGRRCSRIESERKLINDSLLSDVMKAQVREKSFYSHLRRRWAFLVLKWKPKMCQSN
jgi:hypothetical protein